MNRYNLIYRLTPIFKKHLTKYTMIHIHPYWMYSITPIFGFLRNYCKYKQICFEKFIRTPFTYACIHCILTMIKTKHILWKTLIFERWFFFVYKLSLSIINDDYHQKKEKYIEKYGLVYT